MRPEDFSSGRMGTGLRGQAAASVHSTTPAFVADCRGFSLWGRLSEASTPLKPSALPCGRRFARGNANARGCLRKRLRERLRALIQADNRIISASPGDARELRTASACLRQGSERGRPGCAFPPDAGSQTCLPFLAMHTWLLSLADHPWAITHCHGSWMIPR